MRFSSPSNLASSDFLAVPPLTRVCSNLPFGTQERSWKLESHLQKLGDKSVSLPTGPHLVSELNKLCIIIATIEHKHLYQTTLMWRSHYNEFRLPNCELWFSKQKWSWSTFRCQSWNSENASTPLLLWKAYFQNLGMFYGSSYNWLLSFLFSKLFKTAVWCHQKLDFYFSAWKVEAQGNICCTVSGEA